jgi:hypothetical protein
MSASRQLIESESSRRAFQAIHSQLSFLNWKDHNFKKLAGTDHTFTREFPCHPTMYLTGRFILNTSEKAWDARSRYAGTVTTFISCQLMRSENSLIYSNIREEFDPFWKGRGTIEREVTQFLKDLVTGIEHHALRPPDNYQDYREKREWLNRMVIYFFNRFAKRYEDLTG